MDAATIGVIVFTIIFMVGGLIFAHCATKTSENIQYDNKKKENEMQQETINKKSK